VSGGHLPNPPPPGIDRMIMRLPPDPAVIALESLDPKINEALGRIVLHVPDARGTEVSEALGVTITNRMIKAKRRAMRPPRPPAPPAPTTPVGPSLKRPLEVSPPNAHSSGSTQAVTVEPATDMDQERSITPTPPQSVGLGPAELNIMEEYASHISSNHRTDGDTRFATIALDLISRICNDDAFQTLPLSDGKTFWEIIQAMPIPRATPAASAAPPPRDPNPRVEGKAPPKKKIHVTTDVPSPPPVPKESASAKAVVAPPSLPKRPNPKAAPPVSIAQRSPPRRKGKHTTHGPSRRGINLTLPTGSPIAAASFTPKIISDLNCLIAKDLQGDLCLTAVHAAQHSIFIESMRVPSQAETAFVLKHIRRFFPTPVGQVNIAEATPTSTSYLKVIDVPRSNGPSKEWASITHESFKKALQESPAGIVLAKSIKHEPRIMRTSPHADSCIAWVDIHDSVTGASARKLIGQFIPIGGVNCRIIGAKPHSGSILCTRCMRWGHHFSKCRAKSTRCSLCGGPHSEVNHNSMVDTKHVNLYQCVNCTAAKREKHSHSAMDKATCPFWKHRFDRKWLRKQFPRS
jgi:hypothetical protein